MMQTRSECRRTLLIRPELVALTTWDSAEYAAGFRARTEDATPSEEASHEWWCGWEDADADLAAFAQHRLAVEAGRTDDYGEDWGLLFDSGGDARGNGIPFDENRTDPWKEGWIDVDVKLGTVS